uniref:Spermatogenesis associated 7 n=1 Tax=Heterorhabditis bacteriophora TaxID=37862 RepID=A0A1I7XBN4_HETBA
MLSEWLCSLPTYDAEKQKVGTEYADRCMIGHLENAIKKIPSKMEFKKSSINPSRLYRVIISLIFCFFVVDLVDKNVRAEAEANFHLLDRVVYTLQGEKPVTTEMTGKKSMNWKTKKTRVHSKQLPTMLPDSAHYVVKRPHTINDDKPMCCTVFNKDECICSHKYVTSSQYSWRQRKIGEHQSERKDRNASNSGLQDGSSHRQDIYNVQPISHILGRNLHSAPSREHSPIFSQMENITLRNDMHKTQSKGHSFNNSQRRFVSSSFPKDLKLTDMKPSTVGLTQKCI